jgi:hypothetical protein
MTRLGETNRSTTSQENEFTSNIVAILGADGTEFIDDALDQGGQLEQRIGLPSVVGEQS